MLENGFLGQPGTDTVAESSWQSARVALDRCDAERVNDAVALMRNHDISQAPVLDNGQIAGVLDESNLLDHLLSGGEATTLASITPRRLSQQPRRRPP